jgi:hypothetical protein
MPAAPCRKQSTKAEAYSRRRGRIHEGASGGIREGGSGIREVEATPPKALAEVTQWIRSARSRWRFSRLGRMARGIV